MSTTSLLRGGAVIRTSPLLNVTVLTGCPSLLKGSWSVNVRQRALSKLELTDLTERLRKCGVMM